MPLLKKIAIVIPVCLAILVACKDKSETTGPDEPEIADIVGQWDAVLFFPTLINLDLSLTINETDSSSRFYAMDNDRNSDTVYRHEGAWSLNEKQDTIFLDGASCAKLNATSGAIQAFDCGSPLAINLNIIEDTIWRVPIMDMKPVAESQGFTIPNMLQESYLDLIRQNQP